MAKVPSLSSGQHAPGLADELLQLLARQGHRVPIPVFLCALLLASVASSQLGGWLPWAWLAMVTILLTVRWKVLGRLPAAPLNASRKLWIVVALSGINGLVHASSIGFALGLDAPGRAVQTIVILGLCAGSVVTTGGYRPAFIAFAGTTLIPLSAMWAFGAAGGFHWVDLFTALLILVYGLVLLGLARDAFTLFRDSFEIRQEQAGLNRQLQAALTEAEAASRAKTRFLASASHDLRQPLHTLSLFSAALAMRPLDAGSHQIALHINTALQTLSTQLDALLDVSKLDAGVVPVRRTSFRLRDFLERYEQEYLPLAQAKGLLLTVRCDADAVCETDEVLFGRIIRNLLENALKYTPSGEVSISARLEAGQWTVSVHDSGIGIPSEEHQRVFEEFYQVDNPERDRTHGLGLGLSIVRRLARLLQMDVSMSSVPGLGTTFTLAVPRGHMLTAPDDGDVHPPPTRLEGVTILVLDDEEEVRRGMQTLLEELGCEVQLAGSIAEGIARCEAVVPDLALVDLRLRGDQSGIAAVGQLRQARPGLPAILVTGDTAPDRLKEAHTAGIPMLHKPVSVESLCRAIAAELQQGGSREDGAGSIDG
jgi:signal transduction histidine kinase/CheY-like chemotaxis protein